AHGEELAGSQATAADVFDELHLHRVRVLQLVNEQEAITLLQPTPQLELIAQQVACQEEQVLKVDDAVLTLQSPIRRHRLAGYPQEALSDFDRWDNVHRSRGQLFQSLAPQLVTKIRERILDRLVVCRVGQGLLSVTAHLGGIRQPLDRRGQVGGLSE